MSVSTACPTCGYDLQTGQEECPNCGTIIAQLIVEENLPPVAQSGSQTSHTPKAKTKKQSGSLLKPFDDLLKEARACEEAGDLRAALETYHRAQAYAVENQRKDPAIRTAAQILDLLIGRIEQLLALPVAEQPSAEEPEASASEDGFAAEAAIKSEVPVEVKEPVLPPRISERVTDEAATQDQDRLRPKAEKRTKTAIVVFVIGLVLVIAIACLLFVGLVRVVQKSAGVLSFLATDTSTPTKTSIATHTSTPTKTSTPTITPTSTNIPTPTLGKGSTWERPMDGMEMVYVTDGEFTMGSNEGDPNEKPPHTVSLDDYWIDRTEVTNAMFQKYVTATGYRTDAEGIGQSLVYQFGRWTPTLDKWVMVVGANWLHPRGPSSNLDGLDAHPVVQVSWRDAAAYCLWAGTRLPSEAEWEVAARGTDERSYPWGNQSPSDNLLNFADMNLDAIWAYSGTNDGYQFTAPVGSYPAGASPYGALDMAGNVSEWVADLYKYDYYFASPVSNPTGAESGILRVHRGGQWSYTSDGVRSAARVADSPTHSIDYLGFRCARTP